MTTKELHLSVMDQNIVRVYTSFFSVFPFPGVDQREGALKALAHGLQVTLVKFPFLAGTVQLADAKSGKLSLTYPAETPDVQLSGLLTSRTLTLDEFPHTYKQLKRDGMPPSVFTGKFFCPRDFESYPGIPDGGEGKVDFAKSEAPALRVQAIFIPGGLVVGTCKHHSVCDFSGTNHFWKHFARSVREQALGQPSATFDIPDQSGLRSQLDANISPHTEGHLNVESYVDGVSEYTKTLPSGPETPRSHRLFVIPADRIHALRARLEHRFGSSLSVCHVFTALLWIHITRARATRLQQFGYHDSSIGIAVNLRKRVTPQLDEEYMGNMSLYAKATLPIAHFIAEPRVSDATILPTLDCIKTAISAVNNGWVDQHLKFFKAINLITDTECALRFSLGPDLYITSWKDFSCATQEWDIPGTSSSSPEFIRRAYNPSDGGIIIIPRKREPVNGVEPPYEVVVRLATEDMERVLAEEGGWATLADRVID